VFIRFSAQQEPDEGSPCGRLNTGLQPVKKAKITKASAK
jgi:hypothetical protein